MSSEDQVKEQKFVAASGAAPGFALPQLAALRAVQPERPERTAESGELVIGRGIQVKGQIGACKTLVVEGVLDASVEVRLLRLLEGGEFKGAAVVQDADLMGYLDGRLTVTGRLRLSPSARVAGEIRYRRIVIEEGGEISGDIAVLTSEPEAQPAGGKSSRKDRR